jgi:hypothetical protein
MSLIEAERWRLRAEEYRAIAASMRDPGSSSMIERLADTYEKMADTAEKRARPLTVELCRDRATECIEFARRVTTHASRVAVLGVAQRWLATSRRHNGTLEFVVTVEHKRTRRRIEIVVDDECRLLACPDGLDPDRLQQLALGQDDPEQEYRFVHRELKG